MQHHSFFRNYKFIGSIIDHYTYISKREINVDIIYIPV